MYSNEISIDPSYAEYDMMGFVYHANYLHWFEKGRLELNKSLGYDYIDMEKAGYISPVHEISILFKKGIKYGDKARLRTTVVENTGFKTKYEYQIYNDQDELCVEGKTSHYIVRKRDFRPVQFKKVFPEWFEALSR